MIYVNEAQGFNGLQGLTGLLVVRGNLIMPPVQRGRTEREPHIGAGVNKLRRN